MHHFNIFIGGAGALQGVQRSLQKAFRDEAVEAAHNYRKARSLCVQSTVYFSGLRFFRHSLRLVPLELRRPLFEEGFRALAHIFRGAT